MKIAVSTTCSDGYVVLLDHLIKSVLKHNPKFNKDFLIFCDGRLRKENRKYLTGLYKGFIFKDVDYNLYQEYGKSDMRFYSLECFNQIEYDRIVFWGSDMLCLKPLDELYEVMKGIGGIAMPKEKRRVELVYNSGSMVVGTKYLNVDTYMALMKHMLDYHHLHDQRLYNIFFTDIQEIDQKYRVLVSECDFVPRDEIIMLHYIYKPTQEHARTHCANWQLTEWDQYDNPGDRYAGIIG